MENPFIVAYEFAYRQSYRKLLLILPFNELVSLIKDKDPLSLGVIKHSVDATQREERSLCLLKFVMDELKEGRGTSFEQLLEVLAVHVDASSDIAVGRVLQSIHIDIEGTVCRTLCFYLYIFPALIRPQHRWSSCYLIKLIFFSAFLV